LRRAAGLFRRGGVVGMRAEGTCLEIAEDEAERCRSVVRKQLREMSYLQPAGTQR
jgi:hypothetical protein